MLDRAFDALLEGGLCKDDSHVLGKLGGVKRSPPRAHSAFSAELLPPKPSNEVSGLRGSAIQSVSFTTNLYSCRPGATLTVADHPLFPSGESA